MVKNVGRADAIIRALLALVFAGMALVFSGQLVVSLIAALAAVVMLGTALTGRCPLYAALGLTTCPGDRQPRTHS